MSRLLRPGLSFPGQTRVHATEAKLTLDVGFQAEMCVQPQKSSCGRAETRDGVHSVCRGVQIAAWVPPLNSGISQSAFEKKFE
jgi:hypothetical protein